MTPSEFSDLALAAAAIMAAEPGRAVVENTVALVWSRIEGRLPRRQRMSIDELAREIELVLAELDADEISQFETEIRSAATKVSMEFVELSVASAIGQGARVDVGGDVTVDYRQR